MCFEMIATPNGDDKHVKVEMCRPELGARTLKGMGLGGLLILYDSQLIRQEGSLLG